MVPGDILGVQEGGRDPEPVRVLGAADGRPAAILPEERTSCLDRTTSAISSYPPSCGAMATPHAASFGDYRKHKPRYKNQNDDFFQAHCIFPCRR